MVGSGGCSECGAVVDTSARFCGQCGAPIANGSGASEERRQVTVLFSDLSGYTEMSEDLDPEVVRELMATVYAEAEAIVQRYGGGSTSSWVTPCWPCSATRSRTRTTRSEQFGRRWSSTPPWKRWRLGSRPPQRRSVDA